MSAPAALAKPPKEDLSVTALYTSQAWIWGGLSCAELFAMKEAKGVFDVTNLALAIGRLFIPRLRSLRHSLVHRHLMIDRVVADAGAGEVLELAAGFSRRGAAMSADSALRYTEVDLPHVAQKKRALLEASEAGRAVLARSNLRFVEADVRTAALAPLVGADGATLVVIAEGLFMYLDASAQRALWSKIAGVLREASPRGTFVFDLVPASEQPRPGLVGRALGWLMKRFTGGKTFEVDARTRDDVAAELRDAGFADVTMLEPAGVARAWGLPFPDVPTQQLLFVCKLA